MRVVIEETGMKTSFKIVWPKSLVALGRGFSRRCPRCGEGHLFAGTRLTRFIKLVDQCNVCHERFGHIRADDIPAYFSVFLVGHIMLSGLLVVAERQYPAWAQFAVAIPLAIILLYLFMPSVKGAVAARLWSLGMPTGAVESEAEPARD
jgi:uncharacterized protein (DUF983 family)